MKKARKSRPKGGNPAKARAKPTLAAAPRQTLSPRPPIRRSQSVEAVHARVAVRVGAWNDDRQTLALLLAPFLIVAGSLAINQTMRPLLQSEGPALSAASTPITPPRPTIVATRTDPALSETLSLAALRSAALPAQSGIGSAIEAAARNPESPIEIASIAPTRPDLDASAPARPESAPIAAGPVQVAPRTPQHRLVKRPPLARLSLLIAPSAVSRPESVGNATPASTPSHQVCEAPQSLGIGAAKPYRGHLGPRPPASAFGAALAAAAQSQLGELVIYNPRYRPIAFPLGDVSPMFGVCTDVIVRAYREVGFDLQALVQSNRGRHGDPHIDHRRVDVLRRFFETQGQKLPISDFAEDFQPGDIVTYYRPQNRSSTSHIAIVTDKIAPSGRPMIIHNRGWGPQIEDALFVDQMTGHFRYSGPPMTKVAPPIISTPDKPQTLKSAAARKPPLSDIR